MEFQAPAAVTDYDELPYPGKFYTQSNPMRLASLAILHGLIPAPVQQCRVLELGCGDGANLLPAAYALPESQFVGIDLSAAHIATGHARVKELELTNVHLCAKNLLDFSEDYGQFDYIIAHGVYSWVPPAVREQMLKICSRHLSPNGIAYISYNALPGGLLRRYARDLMLFHTRSISDPARKINEARNILDFAVSASPKATIEREILKREAEINRNLDSFMYHDILSEVNEPVYFLDFLNRAAEFGLQFLAEATPSAPAFLPDHVRKELDALPDRRIREQYLDFLYGRKFRQTLLCRTGHQLIAAPGPDALTKLLIAGSLHPTTTVSTLTETDVVEFRGPRGQTVKVREAAPKAVYLLLDEAFPRALSLQELLEGTAVRLGLDPDPELRGKIARMLISSYVHGVIQFLPFEPPFTTEISEKPVASRLARMQAASDGSIVSMMLASYSVEDRFVRRVLTLLDGSRDHAQLVEELSPMGDDTSAPVTAETIGNALKFLAKSGLLIA